jgi:aryl-alcohol dehydrogenase-like predicted oxidoreductase
MRLSTDADRDERRALETIAAALEAGITVFDTAHAYGHGFHELGHNERLVARALRRAGAESRARIVTKGGMARADGRWLPDGRAKSIRADCEASLVALDGLEIDTYLAHAPDPRTPWRTTVRAFSRILDEGLVRRIGIANVNRRQLEEALAVAPIAVVQVALSPFDDSAVRGGLLERCAEDGLAVIAHSPLGGPRRAGRLLRDGDLNAVAGRLGAAPAEVALAWLLRLSPNVVVIPGARRPETARSAARAAALRLPPGERRRLDRAFGRAPQRVRRSTPSRRDADVVLVMGIPGAGKSRVAEEYAARGYLRLNRDERGGTLRSLAEQLDSELATGTSRVVLDNTYLTRAVRSYVVEATGRHRTAPRCIWVDTPLAQAQVNMVERVLDRNGALPPPDELEVLARREPGLLTPTSQMRALRELEPPALDEGFAEIEVISFEPAASPSAGGPGVFVAAAVLERADWAETLRRLAPAAPHLVFHWRPGALSNALTADASKLAEVVDGPVESALCPHAGGPPRCWCRPPLPGLPLAFARAHGVDPARSVLVGTTAAHRTLATSLAARYVEA